MNTSTSSQGTRLRRKLAMVVAVPALGLTLAAVPAGSRPAATAAGVISTVAGGVGGPGRATGVAVTTPCGASFGDGSLYIAAISVVRKIKPATDWLTTPAGAGNAPLGDGGPADLADLRTCGTAVDHHGNLVIADKDNNRVRVVAASTGSFYGQPMTTGHIYTVAGNGTGGFSGDGGLATAAELNGPYAVAVDDHGNLVIADTGNSRVRVVAASTGSFYGQAMTAGHIYTVAGDGIAGFSGDGGKASAAELNDPWGVALDHHGDLVIADTGNSRIRVVAASTGSFYGQAMTAGHIYTVAGNGKAGFSGDGGPATAARLSDNTFAIAVDGAGNLAIDDGGNNRIRLVAAKTGTFYGQPMTAGDIYTVAGNGTGGFSGDGGPATAAEISGDPDGVTADGDGNLVIADFTSNRVRVVAAKSGTFYRKPMTAGDIYTVAGNDGPSFQEGAPGYSGDRGPALRAELADPAGIVTDRTGNLVMADVTAQRIRVVAAKTGTFYARPMTRGDIYTLAGDGTAGFSGDGGLADHAELDGPSAVALDTAGNLLIADTGNNRIRVVAGRTGTFYGKKMTAGHIYTVAGNGKGGFSGDGGLATKATLKRPGGVAVDTSGNLAIADTGNDRVRVVAAKTGTFYGTPMTAEDIYTVSQPRDPRAVAADHAGNLVVGVWLGNTDNDSEVQVVAGSTGSFYGQPMTAGGTYTIAGNFNPGFSGDGGPATAAELAGPSAIAVDAEGNLAIADTDNERIRVVAEHTGSFYGQPMTAGDIYTVAGNGDQVYSGDGGPAKAAGLALPDGVAAGSAGDLLIADTDNHRIREVTG